jgi:BirA family biotin operon repressor/biotin-[acetyl-CoA-carboxylase] ligase
MNPEFAAAAAGFPEPFRLLVREEAGSTNDELRALAQAGQPAGMVLLALRQTAGRGRRGAAWFAAPDESLAFSVLVRPSQPKALWPRLALGAGLAVAEAMDAFGAAASVKWPNDVWIGRRKLAGILIEAGEDFVVIGIGINVNSAGFPPEIAGIASSLRLATGREHSRADVLHAVIHRLACRCPMIDSGFPELLDSLRPRCALTGRRVRLHSAAGPLEGAVEGIAPGGELLLRNAAGLHRLMQADEVRILD